MPTAEFTIKIDVRRYKVIHLMPVLPVAVYVLRIGKRHWSIVGQISNLSFKVRLLPLRNFGFKVELAIL